MRVFEGHDDSVWEIDISPNGRRMISADSGGGILLWDLVFGEPVARFAPRVGLDPCCLSP